MQQAQTTQIKDAIREDPENIPEFFASIALPTPVRNNSFASWDSGRMIFVNFAGLIIRLSSKPNKIADQSDYVLQPIGRRIYKDLTIDFVPGILPPDKNADYTRLKSLLRKDQAELQDAAARNVGKLPDGTTVVLDVGAVKTLSESTQKIAGFLNLIPSPRFQHKIYSELIENFNQCWPVKYELPEPDTFKNFWQECKIQKEKGVLVSAWEKNSDNQYVNQGISRVQALAENYQKMIDRARPV